MRMTIKVLKWGIPVVLIFFIGMLWFGGGKNIITGKVTDSPTPKLHLATYKTDRGWGYSISVGNKVFIKQDYIPVIPGKRAFPDEQSAKRTGELVLKKITQRKIPSLTADELISLGVINKRDLQQQ